MNHLANILISALGLSRRELSATNRSCAQTAPMRQLSADELHNIAGGDETGPRGGW
jgi:hypothetical protein